MGFLPEQEIVSTINPEYVPPTTKKERSPEVKKISARLKGRPVNVVHHSDDFVSKEAYEKLNKNFDIYIRSAVERIRKLEDKIVDLSELAKNGYRTGEWRISSDGYYPYCSICHGEPNTRSKQLPAFCPECGSRNRMPSCSVCAKRSTCDANKAAARNYGEFSVTPDCWAPPGGKTDA